MFYSFFTRYINNFRGFSREIWILAIVTFINRAGVMVVPFLSKYLKENLHFTYSEVGWIMVGFGVGSVCGSWLGGKLSDKIGFYKIMLFSLFVSGIVLILLQFVNSFWGLVLGLFVLMVIADMFRPAMFVAIGAYAKPENRTRALTLVRLAINIGFAAGPALGGLIIMYIGYSGLFWIDGSTCIISIILFGLLVKEKKKFVDPEIETVTIAEVNSVFHDKPFWIFLVACLISGVLFFQLFTTIPLYHHEQFNLTELQTGLLLTLNGLIIFFLEMPFVSYIERNKISKLKVCGWGLLLMTISLSLLMINFWSGILIVMMVFMTFGEMFVFPFSNSFALSRAPKGHEGRYMAIFTMSYSCAHIFSSKAGLDVVSNFGYQKNWFLMTILGIISIFLIIWVIKLVDKENTNLKNS
ncbi:TPA: MDR family MFS transporter [Flavobacterium psychrophilum]|uniref:MDR family MFS transporter n=1 Tax=Flavobacterium psychrophilum TaxID=96345 RepID=UPI00073F30A0|nr:MFS transporter [Flavobacterium psychrophilum]EKT3965097.1 MFS transporter [Flavobacterium psychrophilum]MBF2093035.1 MFS transporter [Flavobacterium psychrophilum]SNA72767.1 Major facilitator superfamily (MFS) permease [Flavobacterium psychrophilum]SNB95440.1 Major facilitator superfamily (MFS) permease [Flavobacterium psychrophilum]GAQ48099.1 major facilitator superfamily (MFS) permease [Flavobacterium psychrophilum]